MMFRKKVKSLDESKLAVGGISAGANGALFYGAKHHSLFSQVYALSPVFRPDLDKALLPQDRAAFGRGADFRRQDIVSWYDEHSLGAGECVIQSTASERRSPRMTFT